MIARLSSFVSPQVQILRVRRRGRRQPETPPKHTYRAHQRRRFESLTFTGSVVRLVGR